MNYFLKNLINKYKKNLSLNEYGKIRIKTEGKCFCSENKKHTQDLPKHILEQKGMIQLAAKYGNSAAFLIDFVLKEQKKLNEIIIIPMGRSLKFPKAPNIISEKEYKKSEEVLTSAQKILNYLNEKSYHTIGIDLTNTNW